jgi:hypothetical protein
MKSLAFWKSQRLGIFIGCLAIMALVYPPTALAQGCAAFDIPSGPEYGNFNTGIWYAEGPAVLGHEAMFVKISVQDLGAFPLGQKGNTMKGTETAVYDFGSGDTFQTAISYVVEHNNDPAKFYLNAVEKIIPGSGTGRFAGATGNITTHGAFGISDWVTLEGWAFFTSHGSVCGAK